MKKKNHHHVYCDQKNKKETMNYNDLPFIQSFKVKNQIDSIIFYYQYHRFEFTKNEEQI